MESGVPFCQHCRAPQIRVSSVEDAPVSTIPVDLSASFQLPPQSSPIQWSYALTAAAMAGVISAILMNVFFGFFGIGIAAAGAFAVRLYRQRSGQVSLLPGAGARIGAVSGVFGFGFFCVIAAVGTALFGGGSQVKLALLSGLEQAAARSQDPQAQAALEKLRAPEGLILVLAFSLAFVFTLFVALSSLGGALAASMSRGRRQ